MQSLVNLAELMYQVHDSKRKNVIFFVRFFEILTSFSSLM